MSARLILDLRQLPQMRIVCERRGGRDGLGMELTTNSFTRRPLRERVVLPVY